MFFFSFCKISVEFSKNIEKHLSPDLYLSSFIINLHVSSKIWIPNQCKNFS